MKKSLYDYFMKSSFLDINLKKYYEGTPRFTNYDVENFDFYNKINKINEFFSDSLSVHLKLYYWEPDSQIHTYIRNFNYDFENLKLYHKRSLPGVALVRLRNNDSVFIQNILFNHFNKEFSLNPCLDIRPYFLIHKKTSLLLLEIYDDRGFNVFFEPL